MLNNMGTDSSQCTVASYMATEGSTNKIIYVSMAILFAINWLNFVDRYTTAI